MTMTYDELLEKIYYIKAIWIHPAYVGFEGLREAANSMNALIATVKIHKPMETEYPELTYCNGCQEYGALNQAPCPTIEAIKKEFI